MYKRSFTETKLCDSRGVAIRGLKLIILTCKEDEGRRLLNVPITRIQSARYIAVTKLTREVMKNFDVQRDKNLKNFLLTTTITEHVFFLLV